MSSPDLAKGPRHEICLSSTEAGPVMDPLSTSPDIATPAAYR